MNCDGIVDQTDLFSFIKDIKSDDILNQACYKDIQDVQNLLNQKQQAINMADPVLDNSTAEPKIKDIEKYLQSKKQKTQNRDGFLEVFTANIKDKAKQVQSDKSIRRTNTIIR